MPDEPSELHFDQAALDLANQTGESKALVYALLALVERLDGMDNTLLTISADLEAMRKSWG